MTTAHLQRHVDDNLESVEVLSLANGDFQIRAYYSGLRKDSGQWIGYGGVFDRMTRAEYLQQVINDFLDGEA